MLNEPLLRDEADPTAVQILSPESGVLLLAELAADLPLVDLHVVASNLTDLVLDFVRTIGTSGLANGPSSLQTQKENRNNVRYFLNLQYFRRTKRDGNKPSYLTDEVAPSADRVNCLGGGGFLLEDGGVRVSESAPPSLSEDPCFAEEVVSFLLRFAGGEG